MSHPGYSRYIHYCEARSDQTNTEHEIGPRFAELLLEIHDRTALLVPICYSARHVYERFAATRMSEKQQDVCWTRMRNCNRQVFCQNEG